MGNNTFLNKAMTQEEKLERAKELYPTANADQRYVLECLFPELTESQGERVLEIIKHCIESRYLHTSTIKGISQKECFAWLEKQGQKPQRMLSAEAKEALWPDKYEGLTDFERTLADVCIGWIGEELGWKQYIKDNADVLLKIAIKKFNSVQEKPAWSEEDEEMLDGIIFRCEKYGHQEQINWLKSIKQRIIKGE